LTERFVLQFKAEAFNFTIPPRFGNPAANVSNMAVNAAGVVTNPNNFMAIARASDERKFRFGLRLGFWPVTQLQPERARYSPFLRRGMGPFAFL